MLEAPKKSILIVEDEEAVSFALGEALKSEGFDVSTAPDGAQGLKLALEKHPDLILADLLMPGMNGLEMIREIRKDSWGEKAMVIILTNVSDVGTLEHAMQEGTFYYIMKGDTSMQDVVAKVKAQLLPPQPVPVAHTAS
jgi:two-component system OmpR family response regulator